MQQNMPNDTPVGIHAYRRTEPVGMSQAGIPVNYGNLYPGSALLVCNGFSVSLLA
jgi:hypothetical protein